MRSIESIEPRFCNAKLLNNDTNNAKAFTATAAMSTTPKATTARDTTPSVVAYPKLSMVAVTPVGSMMLTIGFISATINRAIEVTNNN